MAHRLEENSAVDELPILKTVRLDGVIQIRLNY